MKIRLILLSAFLVLSIGAHSFAQEKKQTGGTTTTAKSETESETQRPKTVVDELLEKARERGEPVLGVCLQDCGESAVQGDLEAGRALELPKPRYSPLARAAHVSGTVVVQLIIDVDGTVMAAAAVSGHPLLYGVSVEAAKSSLFSPTKLNGKPVKVTGVIRYNFVSQ
jgi:outer membrane biosynthesis protein TonB